METARLVKIGDNILNFLYALDFFKKYNFQMYIKVIRDT